MTAFNASAPISYWAENEIKELYRFVRDRESTGERTNIADAAQFFGLPVGCIHSYVMQCPFLRMNHSDDWRGDDIVIDREQRRRFLCDRQEYKRVSAKIGALT